MGIKQMIITARIEFEISNTFDEWEQSFYSMQNEASLAFAYNKNTLERPIIGCGVILDGQPKLLPMILEKGGRWNGETP